MEKLIRPMTAADISASLMLWQSTEGLVLRTQSDNEQSLARFLERNPELSFVTESDGKMAGNVLCGHDGRRGYIYHLAVAPDFRREGCARAMLASALKALASLGIPRCHAFVRFRNLTALKFWNSADAEQRPDVGVVTISLQDPCDSP